MPSKAGEEHYAARLSWAKVRDIRARVHKAKIEGTPPPTCTQLGEEYEISGAMVSMIVNNKRWREDKDPARAAG